MVELKNVLGRRCCGDWGGFGEHPRGSRRRRLYLLLCCAVALGLAGCSHVVAYTTPYYKDGPSQLAGPQGDLEEGTPVLVVGGEGSYARVWTAGGIDAYVVRSSLVPFWQWRGRKPTDESEKRKEREPLVIPAER